MENVRISFMTSLKAELQETEKAFTSSGLLRVWTWEVDDAEMELEVERGLLRQSVARSLDDGALCGRLLECLSRRNPGRSLRWL